MKAIRLNKGVTIVFCLMILLCLSLFSTALAMTPASQASADYQSVQPVQATQVAADSAGWPDAPSGLTVLEVTKSRVTLQWDKVEGAQSYKVYTASSETGKYKLLKTLTATKLIHNVKLGKSTKYYAVCAVKSKKNGTFSAPVAVTLATAPIAASDADNGTANTNNTSATGDASNTSALDEEYNKIVRPSYVISSLNEKYLSAINADRKANGLPELKYRADLTETAMVKAADMMAAGYFYEDHISPTYGHPTDMGKKYLGYPIAENIMDATGPWQNDYADAADLARDKFMNSPKHRATRLDKSLKYIGFAMYFDGNRICICEHFSIE